MSTYQQAASLLQYLPEQKQLLILELIKGLLDDDVATEEDLADIAAARAEYAAGETIRHEDIDWN